MVALLARSPMRQAGGQRHDGEQAKSDRQWRALPVNHQAGDENQRGAQDQQAREDREAVLIGRKQMVQGRQNLRKLQAFLVKKGEIHGHAQGDERDDAVPQEKEPLVAGGIGGRGGRPNEPLGRQRGEDERRRQAAEQIQHIPWRQRARVTVKRVVHPVVERDEGRQERQNSKP